MLTEERRTQLDGIVQQMALNGEGDDAIQFVVDDFKQKYDAPVAPTQAPQKPILESIGSGLDAVFGGGKAGEAFGAGIAKTGLTGLSREERRNISFPTVGEIAGDALQTGALFAPIGKVGALATKGLTQLGVHRGAGILGRSAVGAATGAAFDAASSLKEGGLPKIGAGAAIGSMLPVLGKITGLTGIVGNLGKASRKLEEINLRLTPVDKQNLAKQGKDIAAYLAHKRIIGSPASRYQKVNRMYDVMEGRVQKVIEDSGVAFNRNEIVEAISAIPEKYADNLSEYPDVVRKVNKILNTLQAKHPEQIAAGALNKIKRAEYQSAYARNQTDVINEVSHDVASILKERLDTIPGLKPLNKEYGNLIVARRVLFKAQSRPQLGLIGKGISTAASTAVGGALGGAGGAAAGAVAGPQVGGLLAGTRVRSAVGAGADKLRSVIEKLPTDEAGNVSKKVLLNLSQRL